MMTKPQERGGGVFRRDGSRLRWPTFLLGVHGRGNSTWEALQVHGQGRRRHGDKGGAETTFLDSLSISEKAWICCAALFLRELFHRIYVWTIPIVKYFPSQKMSPSHSRSSAASARILQKNRWEKKHKSYKRTGEKSDTNSLWSH